MAGNLALTGCAVAPIVTSRGNASPSLAQQTPGKGGGGGGGITQFSLGFDHQTPEQISINCPVTSAVAAGSKVLVEYKVSGAGTWLQAHPLARITPAWIEVEAGDPVTPVDAFAGAIFDLASNTTYDIRLTLQESGQPDKTLTGTRATRALPAAAGTPNKTLTTAGNLQTTLSALNPGDVLQLANGTYTVSGLVLARSGTLGSPIYIRGESRNGVIIKDTTGVVLEIDECSHVVIENLTIEGSSADSGQAASSIGIQFWSGRSTPQTNIVFREVTFKGVDQGIECTAEINDCLVYNCDLTGNNLWNSTFLANNGQDTWNDDGICMPGLGNCAWNNTLRGFGDAFSVKQLTFSAAVYFWRNWVPFTGDDSFEADHAVRNIGFYDNFITNCGTLLSLDPLYGGPLYCFRNICINTFRGPHKWNVGSVSRMEGWCVYNNTVVREEGTTGAGWYQPPNGDLRSWSFRNNVTIYRGSGPMLIMDPTVVEALDFDHNAWWSPTDKRFRWNSTYYANLATALSSLAATTPVFGTETHRHQGDIMLASDPFSATVTLGADHTTQVTGMPDVSLPGGSSLKNAGVAIPGITDGFSGAAPDMGAVISGRSLPVFGDMPGWAAAVAVAAWYQVPGTSISLVDPTPLPAVSNTGPRSKVEAYSGFCMDSLRGRMYNAATGGHMDYCGNEIDETDFDRAVPVITQIEPPTPNAQIVTNAAYYADGKPSARHSYYGEMFDPTRRQIVIVGGARYGNGARLWQIDVYDIATRQWLPQGSVVDFATTDSNIAFEENGMRCLDPRNGNIFVIGNLYAGKLDRAANTFTIFRNGNSPVQGTGTCSAFDTKRNRIYMPTAEYLLDPDTNAFTAQAMTGAARSSIAGQIEQGCTYCEELDCYFVRDATAGGGTVWKIDAATFVATTFATTGGSGIPAQAHCFTKLHYSKRLRGLILCPDYFTNQWYLRAHA